MDPIADMLTQIRNAQAVKNPQVSLFFSDIKYEIARILEENGFVEKIEKKGRKSKKFIDLILKYNDKKPAISGLKRISKPGQRIYAPFSSLRAVKGGFGIAIISTPKGIMTNKEARSQKVGGEVLCEVW